jgi:hypothetical protein
MSIRINPYNAGAGCGMSGTYLTGHRHSGHYAAGYPNFRLNTSNSRSFGTYFGTYHDAHRSCRKYTSGCGCDGDSGIPLQHGYNRFDE